MLDNMAGEDNKVRFCNWEETWEVRKYGRCYPWLNDSRELDPEFKKLNLGSGSTVFDNEHGWMNMDMNEGPGIVTHDMYKTPWPFDDNSFDYVFMSNILEHVCGSRWFIVIDELFRVTKEGGYWEIQGPDPNIVVETLQAPSHTGLVGPWTFLGYIISHEMSDLNLANMSEKYRLEPIDCIYDGNRPRKWVRFYCVHIGPFTDWHLRRYLGRRFGEVAARIIGKAWNLRLVYRVVRS